MKDSGVEIYSYLMGDIGEQAAEDKKAAGFYRFEDGTVTLRSLMEMMGDGGK